MPAGSRAPLWLKLHAKTTLLSYGLLLLNEPTVTLAYLLCFLFCVLLLLSYLITAELKHFVHDKWLFFYILLKFMYPCCRSNVFNHDHNVIVISSKCDKTFISVFAKQMNYVFLFTLRFTTVLYYVIIFCYSNYLCTVAYEFILIYYIIHVLFLFIITNIISYYLCTIDSIKYISNYLLVGNILYTGLYLPHLYDFDYGDFFCCCSVYLFNYY